MNTAYKLKIGTEIRVIAPSSSWRQKQTTVYKRAAVCLEGAGFHVSFGKYVAALERFGTASIGQRLADLHDAYGDPQVKAIMSLSGGWSANELLPGINWKLLKRNPKPFIGFSDITVLVNAIYAMTGATSYLGPTFSNLGIAATRNYTLENLLQTLSGHNMPALKASSQWRRSGQGRKLARTRPWKVIQPGSGSGTIIGGNLGSFYLLQGTPYQPAFNRPVILAVEDDDEPGRYSGREFRRRMESLVQLPGVRENVRGILIGRFQPSSRVSLPDIRYVVQSLNLNSVPVAADIDFGHTLPMLTLPIGGVAELYTEANQANISLLEY